MARFSVKDSEAYERYSRDVTRQCRFIQPLLMRTAPDPASFKPKDIGEIFTLLNNSMSLALIKWLKQYVSGLCHF